MNYKYDEDKVVFAHMAMRTPDGEVYEFHNKTMNQIRKEIMSDGYSQEEFDNMECGFFGDDDDDET